MLESNSIEELFGDADYCRDEILRIRDAIGSTKATEATFEAARSSLAYMLLHGPQTMQLIIRAQFNELTKRHRFFVLKDIYKQTN